MQETFESASAEHQNGLMERGYGWRARIGFLSPGIVDETLSRQFYRMAPDGVTMVRTSLGVTSLTVGEINDAIARADAAARELKRENPDCIIIGGSPTVVVGGFGSDAELAARIEKLTDIPTTTAQTAAVEAFRALGVQRLALATPFPEPFNSQLADFLEKTGFSVRSVRSLDRGYRQLTRTPLQAGYDLARASYNEAGDAEGIYFPGAPFPVADLIDRLERELDTTVVSSMQATLWKGMQLAGASSSVGGFGKLLRLAAPTEA